MIKIQYSPLSSHFLPPEYIKVQKGPKNQAQGGLKYRNEYINGNNAVRVLKLHTYAVLIGSL